MELGCCVAPEQIATLAAAGGDYAELTVAGAVMGGDEVAFAQLVAQIGASPIKPLAYNVFLPGDRAIVGPSVDRDWLTEYSREALARIARLSGPDAIVVLGSGRSRSIPAGFDRATALDQLADFLGQLGTLARPLGITIALEHLRRAESNVFTSLRESGDFLRVRDLPNVHLLVDLYHLMEEDEPLNTIDEYADLLVHAHVADSERRHPGTGTYPIAPFFDQLRQHGYTGKCSIECRWTDFPAEIGPAMTALNGAVVSRGS
ncbi:MAG TPA: sugar phosphate isomerase/epimerase family protein [Thermomicrobiales bacterium]|jgi:sugar phosphate isomerase/epimerase